MLPTSQTASQHASIAASLSLHEDERRVGRSLVVLDLGVIAVGIDKTAELVLDVFATRGVPERRLCPLPGRKARCAVMLGRWLNGPPRQRGSSDFLLAYGAIRPEGVGRRPR